MRPDGQAAGRQRRRPAGYAAAAAQGQQQDVFENVRQQLIRRQIAVQKLDGPLSDSALRAAYQQAAAQLTQKQLGYIQCPDQATADAVLDQLTKPNPGSYAAIAAQNPGQYTRPPCRPRRPTRCPPAAQGVAAAAPNSGFTLPWTVRRRGRRLRRHHRLPTFEDARAQLEQAGGERRWTTSAQKLVAKCARPARHGQPPLRRRCKNGSARRPDRRRGHILGGDGRRGRPPRRRGPATGAAGD